MNYNIIPLTGPSGSQAYGLNSNGDAGGISFEPASNEGALWYWNGSETFLAADSYLYSLNDFGAAVGIGGTGNGPTEFALFFQGGATSDLSGVVGKGSACTDINNSGLACGGTWFGSGTKHRAFIYDTGNASVVWIDPIYGNSAGGSAINENGDVVGTSEDSTTTHGFFYSGGSTTDIGACTFISDLNNSRQIVGSLGKTSPQNFSPATWDASTLPATVKELPVPSGFLGGHAQGINSAGMIVGTCWTQSTYDGDQSAFLYDGTKSVDLNSLISDSRWHLQFANKINDSGQIVGTGTFRGQQTAFLLNPMSGYRGTSNIIGLVASLIFGGVTVDGGGTVVFGGVPIPIGPWSAFPEETKQAMLGLVIDQLALNITDSKAREIIRSNALDQVRTSVDRMIANIGKIVERSSTTVSKYQSFRMGKPMVLSNYRQQLLRD